MAKPVVIYSNHPLSVVGDDFDNTVIVVQPDALRDYDYLSSTVEDLFNADLDGPEVARLVADVCQRFLAHYDEHIDLTHDYANGDPDFHG